MRKLMSGITTWAEARYAMEQGMDALGFVLEPKSHRYVDPEKAREIILKLPPLICTVGVFQDTPRYAIQELTTFCRLDWLLFLGNEDPQDCRGYSQPIIKFLPGFHHHVNYTGVNAFLLNDRQALESVDNTVETCYFLVPGASFHEKIPGAFGLYFLLNADGTICKTPLARLRLPETDLI